MRWNYCPGSTALDSTSGDASSAGGIDGIRVRFSMELATSGFCPAVGHCPRSTAATCCEARCLLSQADLVEAPAEWGATMTLFILSKGLLGSTGSCSKTSSPAPRIFPSFNACMRSGSLTTDPLHTFTKKAVGFMQSKCSLRIMCRVSLLSGTWTEM